MLVATGHEVLPVDVSLRGAPRWLAGAATFAPSRERWRARFTLEGVPFRLRSLQGAQGVRQLSIRPDCGLQIGATFDAFRGAGLPYFLCCDSNIKVAISARMTGFSHASVLSETEFRGVIAREAGVCGRASGIFTLSEQLRRSFIQDFGLPPERVHCIYAGPNLDLADARPAAAGDRPPGDSANILFVGAQSGRKGGDTLLAAFGRVRERYPAARLIVIGPERSPTAVTRVEYLGFLPKGPSCRMGGAGERLSAGRRVLPADPFRAVRRGFHRGHAFRPSVRGDEDQTPCPRSSPMERQASSCR